MKKNTRSLVAYALSISMLFNSATDNQNKKVDPAILPEKVAIIKTEESKEDKLKLKLNKANKNYTK